MTNINCTVGCIYQKDGKCNLDMISNSEATSKDCPYFKEKASTKEENHN